MIGKLTVLLYFLGVVLLPLQGIACDHLSPADVDMTTHLVTEMEKSDCHKVDAVEDQTVTCMMDCTHCAGSVACYSADVPLVSFVHEGTADNVSVHILPPHNLDFLRPPIA